MSVQVQFRRGNTAQHSSFTGAPGEITVDTDKKVVIVHDGSTSGGHPVAPASVFDVANAAFNFINSVSTSETASFTVANSAFDKANAANVLAYDTGIGANSYASNVGVSANAYTVIVGNSANNYAGVMANSANAYTDYSLGLLNTSFNTVIVDVANSINSYANQIGTSGNSYAQQVGTSSNSYANVVGDSANAYANLIGQSANSYSEQVASSANNYAGAMVNSSNAYADSTYYLKSGGTIAGDVVVTGNLVISGETIYANTQTLLIGDNILTLNGDLPNTVAPSANSGLEVNRGSGANVSLYWEEINSVWSFTDNGGNVHRIASGDDLATINTFVTAARTVADVGFDKANSANVLAYDTGIGANAYATQVGLSANAYTNVVLDKTNSSFEVANAAFGKANNALANTSGTVFSGDLTISQNLSVGNIAVAGAAAATYVSANSVTIGSSEINSISIITSSATDQVIDTFATTSFRSAQYFVSMNAGTDYHTTQVTLIHNGTDAFITEYGVISTANNLGTFSATVSSGTVRLNVSPTFATNTIRLIRTATIS